MPRHFLTLHDLGAEGIGRLLARASELRSLRGTPAHPKPLVGKSVAILLEKASTRTRISFEVGVAELGGHPLTILSRDTQLARGEPIYDTAMMLSRYVHGVVFRTAGHDRVVELARAATIPVVNGLTDLHHPCQLLADLMTVHQAFGRLEGVRVAWVGDGNNMAHSWIEAAALTGLELVLACPKTHSPDPEILAQGQGGRGRVSLVQDPDEAVRGAHVVTTDVWASMGQEAEAEERRGAFRGYCVDQRRMAIANPDAIFLHCLPAHRGEEVSTDVIDGPASRVWDESENRLHTQKALLEHLIA